MVFGRPRSCLQKVYKKATRPSGDGRLCCIVASHLALPLLVFFNAFVVVLKYYPSCRHAVSSSLVVFFVIKGRETPTKHIKPPVLRKAEGMNADGDALLISRLHMFSRRYWPLEDYTMLFSFLLEKSRKVILDSPPCVVGLRYLS